MGLISYAEVYIGIGICLTITLLCSIFILSRLISFKTVSVQLVSVLTASLILPLSITFLLPIDIDLNIEDKNKTIILNFWRVNYWLTFLLTWVVLPFLQYYISNGEFNTNKRIKNSIFQLLKFQIILIVVFILFLTYMVIYHFSLLNFKFLKSLLISISHIYSLIMAIWLMAHGLIYLPKFFWKHGGNYLNRLEDCYVRLPKFKSLNDDANFEFREVCGSINSLKYLENSVDIEFRDWIIYLTSKVPTKFQNSNRGRDRAVTLIKLDEVNDKLLTKLSEDFKWRFWEYNHSKTILKNKINEIIYLEDIVNNLCLNDNINENESGLNIEWRNEYFKLPSWIVLYCLPILNRLIGVLVALLGLIIVESEILHGTKFCLMKLIIAKLGNNFGKIELILILSYLMCCALISLSRIKIFNLYKVEWNSSSDPISTIFFVSYALRLTIPISYNFLMLLNSKETENSSFMEFLGGSLELVKFCEFLNDILPRLILLPLLLSYFSIWEKLREFLEGYFDLDYFSDDDGNIVGGNYDSTDVENAVGSINRENLLVLEAKSVIQKYLNDPEFASELSIIDVNGGDLHNEQFNLQKKSAISTFLKKLKSVFQLITNKVNLNRSNSYGQLRSYNLTSGGEGTINLNSRNSSDSGISLSSTFDSDNRILFDDDIQNIE